MNYLSPLNHSLFSYAEVKQILQRTRGEKEKLNLNF